MIPFNKPYMTGNELGYILDAHNEGKLAGNGAFTRKCNFWIEKSTNAHKSLLTHSCTAALEMAAILSNIEQGDEIIMPSYTFVSTANAFVLRGAVPVFIDIRKDTLNMNERLIENAITKKTRAIVPVHYAGNSCEMDYINDIANANNLTVIEDAAQGFLSTYKGRKLGSLGQIGAYSFHETKNIISGEGGALVINDIKLVDRAEIVWEKGTDRSKFFRGEVDKYSWVDIGSSYLPGEITAAFLFAQLEEAELIIKKRMDIWNSYHKAFNVIEERFGIKRPVISSDCIHNAHMYYLVMKDSESRGKFIEEMRLMGVQTPFHYVPLHSSEYGKSKGRANGALEVTNNISDAIVRLPLWIGVDYEKVINCAYKFFKNDK